MYIKQVILILQILNKEFEYEDHKFSDENKSPNSMMTSLVHTTKPAPAITKPIESLTKTNDENMFERKSIENLEQQSDDESDDEAVIPVKYLS